MRVWVYAIECDPLAVGNATTGHAYLPGHGTARAIVLEGELAGTHVDRRYRGQLPRLGAVDDWPITVSTKTTELRSITVEAA